VAFSIMPMNSGKDYKAREVDVAQPLMAGGPVGGNQGGDFIAQPVAMINMQGSKGNAVAQADGPSFTLNAMHGHDVHAVAVPVGVTIHGTDPTVQKVASYDEVAQCLRARTPGNIDNSSTTVVQQPVTYDLFNITAPINWQNLQPGDPCHTLARSNAEHAAVVQQPIAWSEELTASIDVAGTIQRGGAGGRHDGVAVPVVVPIAFNWNAQAAQLPSAERDTTINDGLTCSQQAAVAFRSATEFLPQSSRVYSDGEAAPTLQATGSRNGNRAPQIQTAMQVRRLTPTECERLQGFPDNHTAIPWRGKAADQCPDGPRYKALGNSWAVPVVAWIGKRIHNHLAATK
jgi:hypothetical protein